MAALVSFTFIDRGGEQASVTIPVEDPGAITGVGSIEEHLSEFAASLGALSLGDIRRQSGTINITKTTTQPSDPEAQREKGLRIVMVGDDSGRVFTLTVPVADFSVLTFPNANTDEVVLADAGPVAALIVDLEARYMPPWGTGTYENVTVT